MLGAAFVTAQLTPGFAQSPGVTSPAKLARDGYALTRSEAEDIESSLKNKPDDLAARTKLLGFYFRGAMRVYPRDVTIEARRRHILWLIENKPDVRSERSFRGDDRREGSRVGRPCRI